MAFMPHPIRSFDVFDTLIARRCVEPARLLEQLEVEAGIPGLAIARQNADRHLWGLGRPYVLRDLWHEVGRSLGMDGIATERLLQLEVRLEHDEAIPITANLAQVQDGDILVSDTYLPADIVRSLLCRCGLDKQVSVVVSNDGKFRGWVWPKLLAQTGVRHHLGDNPQSDGHTPTTAGIQTALYSGARRSRVEKWLAESGWEPLANLVREVRLANPLPPSRPQERYLWEMSCQLNFPLLLFASHLLESYCQANELRDVFFVSRDCLMWSQLFRALYPRRCATYLYTSRQCLLKPTPNYVEYFQSTWQPGGVIVDLSSTGTSWGRFFEHLKSKARCWFIGHIDNYSYLPGFHRPCDRLDMTAVFRDSELSGANKLIEMLNYAPHPRVEDVILLPGGEPRPVLANSIEYDPALPTAAHNAFRACVQALAHYPSLKQCRRDNLDESVRFFVRLIGADPHLPVIYTGHQAADLAYERQILS